jgi:hypothetical protein
MARIERDFTPLQHARLYGGRHMRPEFDRDRELIVVKPFNIQGRRWNCEEVFDPKQVTVRRLRQLYDSRYLKHMPEIKSAAQPTEAPPPIPKFEELTSAGIKQWLKNHGVRPHPRTSHAKLVELALAKWKEVNDGKPATDGDSEADSAGVLRSADDGNPSTGQPNGGG